MQALVMAEYGRFTLTDVPKPEPAANEVLIHIKACGICGSDVHGMDGSTGRRVPPVIMGHEAAGIIESVGSGITGWQPGDRVTFDSTIYCGKCSYCRQGLINLCDNRRVLGVSCEDYRQDGAFAEYVVVPQHILYALPNDVSFVQAAMVEPVSVAFHAVDRTPIKLNDSAVVVGAGMIGLLVIQALRAAGCGTIIAVDLDAGRLEKALTLGADHAIRSDLQDTAVEIQALTRGQGADHAFEVVGIDPTLQTALTCIHKGGTVTLVGNVAPKTNFPLQQVVTRQITLYGSCASAGEYPACLDMIARGVIDVEALISAIAPLSEGDDWFQRLYKHELGLMKVILEP